MSVAFLDILPLLMFTISFSSETAKSGRTVTVHSNFAKIFNDSIIRKEGETVRDFLLFLFFFFFSFFCLFPFSFARGFSCTPGRNYFSIKSVLLKKKKKKNWVSESYLLIFLFNYFDDSLFPAITVHFLFLLLSDTGRDSLLSERRTRDRKVASSGPGRSGGRIFFSRFNFVSCFSFGSGTSKTPVILPIVKVLGYI